MSFSYKKFIQLIHEEFKEDFSYDEVKDILSVDKKYERDSSSNKSLVVNRLKFTGIKRPNNVPFEFDRNFDSGVNLIIGDNLKGKSTILKAIKFCLTGSSKIRDDINPWIKEYYLEFSIDKDRYTIVIKLEGRQKSTLFKKKIDELPIDLEVDESEIVFQSKSSSDFIQQMESFFFNQFGFYHLQWTAKDSKKDSLKINTANASWKTYYNFLNLESKDSNVMFYGGQSELSYQMLLGLKLTYPINRLKIKKERKEYNLSLLQHQNEKNFDKIYKEQKKLIREKESLQKEISKVSIKSQVLDTESLISERTKLNSDINSTQDDLKSKQDEVRKLEKQIDILYQKTNSNKLEIDALSRAKNKRLKKVNHIKEYLDIGIFFNNIDIQICPHCNHTVEDEQRNNEKNNKECMLCNHAVEEPLTDTETYEDKIMELESDIQKIEEQLTLYETTNSQILGEISNYEKKIPSEKNRIQELHKLEEEYSQKYSELGKKIISSAEQEKKLIRIILAWKKTSLF